MYDEYRVVFTDVCGDVDYDVFDEEDYEGAKSFFDELCTDDNISCVELQGWSFSGNAGNASYDEDYDILEFFEKAEDEDETLCDLERKEYYSNVLEPIIKK